MVLWREEMSVDSIYRNFEFHERAAFFREYPQGYHGADREGRPIYISKPGMIDPKRVLKITTPERIVYVALRFLCICAFPFESNEYWPWDTGSASRKFRTNKNVAQLSV